MHQRQRLCLQIGGLLFAVAFLFPPWLRTERIGNGIFANGIEIEQTSSAGYHFIFSPPDSAPASEMLAREDFLDTSVSIAWSRWLIRLLAIGGIGGALMLVLRRSTGGEVAPQ